MKCKTSSECCAPEKQFLEALRQFHELRTRFQSILDLTRNTDGPVQTADAVEEQLIEALRQLGRESMNPWAAQAEQRVSTELQPQDATGRSRKKNTAVVACLWVGERAGPGLAQPAQELSAPCAWALDLQTVSTVLKGVQETVETVLASVAAATPR